MPTAPHPALSRFLRRLLQRSDLSNEEQDAILRLSGTTADAVARQDLVGPGQTVDSACLVVEGLVARFDQMSDGARQVTSFYLPGDMCDLDSVPSPTAGWGLVAICPSTVLRIPHVELLALTTRYPAIAMAFWRDTIADASVLAKWVGNVGRKDAKAGMAHLFCELGIRIEKAGLGSRQRFRLPATQEQLGEALGITTIHVNRTLKVLRAEGLVMIAERMVEIPDWDALVGFADFDPAYLLLDHPRQRIAA
jgi:CRP-like cAMP-binding protein